MGNGVGLANILAQSHWTATYRGKLIVEDGEQHRIFYLTEQEADNIVANNTPFSDYKNMIYPGPPYTLLKFDDSTPVTLEDTISMSVVPDDAEASFVLEPAYIWQG